MPGNDPPALGDAAFAHGPDAPAAAVLDTNAYPHLLDAIIAYASRSALLALRRTSRTARDAVETVLFEHIVLTPARPSQWNRYLRHVAGTAPGVGARAPAWLTQHDHLMLLNLDGGGVLGGRLVPSARYGFAGAVGAREMAVLSRRLTRVRILDIDGPLSPARLHWFARLFAELEAQGRCRLRAVRLLASDGQFAHAVPRFPAETLVVGPSDNRQIVAWGYLSRKAPDPAVRFPDIVQHIMLPCLPMPLFGGPYDDGSGVDALTPSATILFSGPEYYVDSWATAGGNRWRWTGLVSYVAHHLRRGVPCTLVDLDTIDERWLGWFGDVGPTGPHPPPGHHHVHVHHHVHHHGDHHHHVRTHTHHANHIHAAHTHEGGEHGEGCPMHAQARPPLSARLVPVVLDELVNPRPNDPDDPAEDLAPMDEADAAAALGRLALLTMAEYRALPRFARSLERRALCEDLQGRARERVPLPRVQQRSQQRRRVFL